MTGETPFAFTPSPFVGYGMHTSRSRFEPLGAAGAVGALGAAN